MCSCSTLLVYGLARFPCIACLLTLLAYLACLAGWLTFHCTFFLLCERDGRAPRDCFPMICSIIPWTFMDPLCLIDFHRHRFALASIDYHRLLVPIMIFLCFSLIFMNVHWLLMFPKVSWIFIDFHWFHGFTLISIDFHNFSYIFIVLINFNWFASISLIVIAVHWFPLDFLQFSWIFNDLSWIFIDFSLIFIDFHGFSLIFHWFSLIFIVSPKQFLRFSLFL